MKHVRNSRLTTLFNPTISSRRSLAVFAAGSTMLALAFLVALLMPLDAASAKKGNGKGGGGDPPEEPVLPPVRYVLTWLDWGDGWETRARDVNNSGDVVGFAFVRADSLGHGFLFTAATGMVDLNSLGAAWFDLDADDYVTGWTATGAEGINEAGQIVGTAGNGDGSARATLYDPILNEFLLLPHKGETDAGNSGQAINDIGEIVGAIEGGNPVLYSPSDNYQGLELLAVESGDTRIGINNEGTIVIAGGYVAKSPYTPDDVEHFPGYWFYGINNGIDGNPAMISGSRDRIRGKNGQEGGTIRLSELDTYGDPVEILYPGDLFDIGTDINDAGDVCFGGDSRGFVYTDLINPDTGQEFGAVALDDLVLNQDAYWVANGPAPWAINNPDSTVFGHVCGSAGLPFRAFLLTPEFP